MTCTLSNKCAKNLSKRTVLLQLIIKNVITCFFGTQCSIVRQHWLLGRVTGDCLWQRLLHYVDICIYAFTTSYTFFLVFDALNITQLMHSASLLHQIKYIATSVRLEVCHMLVLCGNGFIFCKKNHYLVSP